MTRMPTRLSLALSLTLCASLLLACGERTRTALGYGKQSPDEFSVVTRAPLSVPPDYGLRPPAPGASRPQEQETAESTRRLLLQGAADRRSGEPDGEAPGRGEAALLERAGAASADPGIRRTVDRESSILARDDDGFLSSILFWQEREAPGVVVDASAESRRLRENAAEGKPAADGRTPVIERDERGWLEGLFN